jgi:hypothetical protein
MRSACSTSSAACTYAAGPPRRVRDAMQPKLAGPREHLGELLRRIAALAAVEAHADELVAMRHRFLERRERGLLGQVTQEAQDERRVDAVELPGLRARRDNPSITALNGTPRSVCVCGSKKSSACTTLSAAARSKYAIAMS